MPIQELFLQAKAVAADLAPPTGIAAALAGLIFLLCGWPWRSPKPTRTTVGGVLSVGAGFFAGCWWLGVRPHWPPLEDQDRFLLILFPAVMVVELVAALFKSETRNLNSEPRMKHGLNTEMNPGLIRVSSVAHWGLSLSVWLLRLVIAVLTSRILLHNSSYITDLSGPSTRQWTPEQTWGILGGLAVALAGVWVLLTGLMQRSPGRAVPLAVAVACAGSAVTIMMSGYASGGPLAMPLAGAVAGVLVASLFIKGDISLNGVLGTSVVGLFAVLVMGHFFGELTWLNAALLFFAPLLGWLPEVVVVGRVKPWLRAFAGIVLTAMPVAIAFALAQQKLVEDSAPPSPDSSEPTLEDYMKFGK